MARPLTKAQLLDELWKLHERYRNYGDSAYRRRSHAKGSAYDDAASDMRRLYMKATGQEER